jgi:DNA-binding GntR family transcriptional regulator
MARTAALPAAANGTASTLATTLYDQLRSDLLAGLHEPGSRLAIEALCERHATSQTPLREALNRLVADGLVQRREQRGFAVAEVSAADLIEITRTRCWLEEIALRESIAAHSAEWEEALVLAHHRLARTPRSLRDDRFEDNPQWEPLHRAFHRALISGCGSRWLLSFCDQLADQHHRYRRLSAPQAFARKRGVKGEHQALFDAAVAGNADQAVALLHAHFERTARVILGDAAQLEVTPPTGRARPVPTNGPRPHAAGRRSAPARSGARRSG